LVSPVWNAAMNDLFIFAYHREHSAVVLKIGTRKHGRAVNLTPDEATQLAHRLLGFGEGKSTIGFEKFTPSNVVPIFGKDKS
jgi:hypothetical protein